VGVDAPDFDLRFSVVVVAGGAFLGDGALGVTLDELFAFHEDRFESSLGIVMVLFLEFVNLSAIGVDVMLFFVNFPAIPTKLEAACGGILKLQHHR